MDEISPPLYSRKRFRAEPPAPIPLRPASEPAKPKPATEDAPDLDYFDAGDEDGALPPRAFLLGNSFCRGILSGVVNAGAGGKTSFRILQALALATGRELTNEHVFVRSRVIFVCLEDDLIELRRRVYAARLHYGIAASEVAGRLYLLTPRGLKIAVLDDKGQVAESALLPALRRAIDRFQADLVILDPAIKSHGLDENSNGQMDGFATLLTGLAVEKNVAVDVLIHERKAGGEAGDANRGRGATALKDAGRLIYTLTGMSDTEAKALSVSSAEQRFLLRWDSAKVNVAPPTTATKWFRLVGVPLDNGNALYPNGDTVQTVEPWAPQPTFEGLDTADLNRALDLLRAGLPNGRKYSTGNAAKERAAWRGVQAAIPTLPEPRCKAIVVEWTRNGMLTEGEYDDPVSRKPASGIIDTKRIGPLAGGDE